jgi:ribosomal-protein-alanine N-acetyltransferase
MKTAPTHFKKIIHVIIDKINKCSADKVSNMLLTTFFEVAENTISSQTFWMAVAAIGGILSLFFIYTQIANARAISAYEFIRKEDDRFRSNYMQSNRSNLAKTILFDETNYKNIDQYADFVLDYFEDLGLLLEKRLVPLYIVWSSSCYYILLYWNILSDYIYWVRKTRNDQTYFCCFEYLHKRIMKYEKTATKKREIEYKKRDLLAFLLEEMTLKLDVGMDILQIRLFSKDDLPDIMKIEQASFREGAYETSQFLDVYNEHPDGFYVLELRGEIIGYSISYCSEDIGEIDSIAVDENFRNCGVGKILMENIMNNFKEKNIKTISLETRITNISAIRFFIKLGFEKIRTVNNYYDNGEDAYLMQTHI